MTLIALTSQNRRQVTEHAGRCRNFLVYEVQGDHIGEPRLIELPLGSSLHETAAGQTHPLDAVDVLISASMGDGLRVKLAERGIQACVTDETDPRRALQRYLAGELATQLASPHAHAHHEGHQHPEGHAHAHAHGHGGCGQCRCAHAAGVNHDA
jgi:predicted Fe-Mo cluster-binding NifX family protein